MSKIIAECKCRKCGVTFERVKYICNDAEAERWKTWTESNFDLCSDCWKQEQNEHGKTLAEKYHLPKITGASEKQIIYAENLRAKYLADNENKLKDVIKMLSELHTVYVEQFTEAVTKSGKSEADYLRDSFSRLAYNGAYTILTTGDARQIIDALTK
nr:MAG TPA: hypothetical protein [Caudoviricetes sp.]